MGREMIGVTEAVEAIARVCHEANRAYCLALGDPSQKAWDQATDETRESARDGVVYLLVNPDASPSSCHDNWLAHKVENGWKLGMEKNEQTKTHPCMVPFKALPAEQKQKDRIFHAIVRTLES